MSDRSKSTSMDKCSTVLWAPSSCGIMLHNFSNGVFVELQGDEALVWERLDGTHSLDAIASLLVAERRMDPSAAKQLVSQVVGRLHDNAFID